MDAGGWRKGMDRRDASHLSLTPQVIEAHLTGQVFIGLYPLLKDNTCRFLVADFDGPTAMLDALAYVKAARANGVPAAVELSQSGRGAHVWVFFTDKIPAAVARAVGTVLVHDAMVLRGSMDLRSYDRLFPNQDVLPDGGFGNLIAAPLQGRRRGDGLTVFLDLATLEPYEDQWVFLSTVDRLSPGEAQRVAKHATRTLVGSDVAGLSRSDATKVHPPTQRSPPPPRGKILVAPRATRSRRPAYTRFGAQVDPVRTMLHSYECFRRSAACGPDDAPYEPLHRDRRRPATGTFDQFAGIRRAI